MCPRKDKVLTSTKGSSQATKIKENNNTHTQAHTHTHTHTHKRSIIRHDHTNHTFKWAERANVSPRHFSAFKKLHCDCGSQCSQCNTHKSSNLILPGEPPSPGFVVFLCFITSTTGKRVALELLLFRCRYRTYKCRGGETYLNLFLKLPSGNGQERRTAGWEAGWGLSSFNSPTRQKEEEKKAKFQYPETLVQYWNSEQNAKKINKQQWEKYQKKLLEELNTWLKCAKET